MLTHLTNTIRSFVGSASDRLDRMAREDAAVRWIGQRARERDMILVRRSDRDERWTFQFPRRGAGPRLRHATTGSATPTFVLDWTRRGPPHAAADWAPLYHDAELRVFEHRSRLRQAPLRWGLPPDEQLAVLAFTRDVLRHVLSQPEPYPRPRPGTVPPYWLLHTDLAVTLRLDGTLRGYAAVERLPLWQAIATAMSAANAGMLSKPVTLAELSRVEIEVALLSSLRVPLPRLDPDTFFDAADKCLVISQGARRTFLVPTLLFHAGIESFAEALSFADSMMPPGLGTADEVVVTQCGVQAFTERRGARTPLSLVGPLVMHPPPQLRLDTFARSLLKWLVRQQDNDGNFVAAVDPRSLLPCHDPIRSCFAGMAMTAYLGAHDRIGRRYLDRARRHFHYETIRLSQPGVRPSPLEYCYAGEEALNLWTLSADRTCLAHALRWGRQLRNYDLAWGGPLVIQHAATLLLRLAGLDVVLGQDGVTLAMQAQSDFDALRRDGRPMALSHFAELVNVLRLRAEVTADLSHRHAALAVADWLLAHRRSRVSVADPPFPHTTAGGVAYASATAKIIEVLPCAIRAANAVGKDPGPYQVALDETLASLALLQYDARSAYGLPALFREQLLGGVRRHARLLPADVDTTGHLLLGLSRLSLGTMSTPIGSPHHEHHPKHP